MIITQKIAKWIKIVAMLGSDRGILAISVNGSYWSSTSNGINNAYKLNFDSSVVSSASATGRRNGMAVRCIFGGS